MSTKWIIEVNVIDNLGLGLTVGEMVQKSFGHAMNTAGTLEGKTLLDMHRIFEYEDWGLLDSSLGYSYNPDAPIDSLEIIEYDEEYGTLEETRLYVQFVNN